MRKRLLLTRTFLLLYGLSGVWAGLGAGILLFMGGEALFGSLLTAGGIILIVLLVDGRFIRESARTWIDLAAMYIPAAGVLAMSGVGRALFPRSSLTIIYVAIYIVLALLPLAELVSSRRRT